MGSGFQTVPAEGLGFRAYPIYLFVRVPTFYIISELNHKTSYPYRISLNPKLLNPQPNTLKLNPTPLTLFILFLPCYLKAQFQRPHKGCIRDLYLEDQGT